MSKIHENHTSVPLLLSVNMKDRLKSLFYNILNTGKYDLCPPSEYQSAEPKESILIPIRKKDQRTDCNNYRGISLLPDELTREFRRLHNAELRELYPGNIIEWRWQTRANSHKTEAKCGNLPRFACSVGPG
ncbi:unnamed protein product [Nezara viridula]|uniref:Uncharacterized protein n=1 Tax=Nezara viridula TaxID=85310 RepID=A0A9P0HBW3_NEZVI|nr:unnamed protein product [Nezara viridula]